MRKTGMGSDGKRGGFPGQTSQTPVLVKMSYDHAKPTHLQALSALVLDQIPGGQGLCIANNQHSAGHTVNSHTGLMNEWIYVPTNSWFYLSWDHCPCLFSLVFSQISLSGLSGLLSKKGITAQRRPPPSWAQSTRSSDPETAVFSWTKLGSSIAYSPQTY